MAKMTGLGKGLDALFGPVPEEEQLQENETIPADILRKIVRLPDIHRTRIFAQHWNNTQRPKAPERPG